MEIDKVYNSKEFEEKIYTMWEKSGYFTPKIDSTKKPFCIIMPPPNANGALHIGHALFVTLQDIMVRYHRMQGEATLWLPGADHAGFETQVVFDKKLEKEGRKRNEVPKDQLLKEMMEFTLKNKEIMEGQFKKLGASCDWTREKFTLDQDIIQTVYQTFEKLKQDDLIYKGSRLVNWCTKHQTSLSDLEIKYEERIDPLYYIKYGSFKLATVRPETKFGDTAIAVNPKDQRYQDYVGKEVEVETVLGKAKIKVIADESVDMEFGTGAVKVTPAHDFADFETWQRHKAEIPEPKVVIDKYGKMNELAGIYQGMKVAEAREKVVADMVEKGLLDETEIDYKYKHNVACCFKCGTVIEPTLMDNQWFIKMTEKPFAMDGKIKRLEYFASNSMGYSNSRR
ncbi:MAG: class I tRNA ligase family protein [Candidatus Gribaldobacteria bacterium]|nr:class I tRNA ligase family protein [Candidatus Gribaldobacteria bacterium]